ncbi:MAG: DUF4080 domain-containing protein, partial [Candidatus Cloacimonadota bacterium]|nr:DUF4080 domain-containing protein [Candidatus Cloacimonadota bacterium]
TQKNIEEVKSEIDFFIKHEVKIVKFVDRTFNASQKFSQVIWSYLSEKNTNTKFHFEIYPSFLNEDAFEILQQVKTHLFQFEIGIQTIHKRTLTEIKRFGDWNKIKPKIERLSKMNIHIHLDQIVGLPFEDYQKIKESFNEIYSLKSDHYQLGFLKVLPGTEMAEKAREYNLIFNSNPPYQIFSNKWLNFSEILLLQKIAKLVEGIYNSHKFERTIKTLENFFENPFDFWEELAIFYKKNDFSFHSKWEVTAKNLQKFADEKLIKQTSESLRWDWHLIANAHYYPEFINDENLIKIKRQNYLWIKEIFATKDFAKYKIKPKDLKKAIFYQNEKEEFLTFSLKKNNKRLIFQIDTKKNQIKELQNIL